MDQQKSRLSAAQQGSLVLAAFVIACTAVWYRFAHLMPTVFYGDDLKLLLYFMDGECATTPGALLTEVCQERFRPLTSGTVLALMSFLGEDIRGYQIFNTGVHALTGLVMYGVAARLAQNRLAAGLLALALIMSRFGAFQVTHVIAPVESLALLLSLTVLYCLLRASQPGAPTWRWCWAAIICAFFAAHAHERYLVVSAWLMVAFVALPKVRALGTSLVALLLLASAAIPAFYIGYKTAVLDAHFLIGTAETHIELDRSLVVEYAKQTALTVFGFNNGPEYLIGHSVNLQWPSAFAAASVFLATWLLLLLSALVAVSRSANGWQQRVDAWCWPVLITGLACALITPTLITVRLELRWFLATFACVLLLAAWAIGRIGSQRVGTSAALLLSLSSILLDGLLLKTFGSMSLFWLPEQAAMIKRDIVDKKVNATGFVFVTRDSGLCDWGLWRGEFFRVYGDQRREITCVTSLDGAVDANLTSGVRVFDEQSSKLVDVTRDVQVAIAERSASRFDFLAEFDKGSISDDRRVDTPNGRGALQMPWDTTSGPRNSLTLLSGFKYRYDDVEIPENAFLIVDASMTFVAPQPARLVIKVSEGGEKETSLLSMDLVVPQAGQALQPVKQRIDLSAYAGDRVSLEFSAESPGGDATAHWIAVFAPRIVVL